MKKYSDFFKTLHDETGPTGNLGRGTHYSILRSASWVDDYGCPNKKAQFHDLAVIWDEDHDERIITAIEKIYLEGLLSCTAAIGERKGMITLLLCESAFKKYKSGNVEEYIQRVQSVCNDIEHDIWSVSVGSLCSSEGIINADEELVTQYLRTLDILWQLGLKQVCDIPPNGE